MKTSNLKDEGQTELIQLIDECYTRFSRKKLPVRAGTSSNRYEWLDEHAEFALLAHNTAANPLFIYANKKALACYGYEKHEFLMLASRDGAPVSEQDNRNRLLVELETCDHSQGHQGTRVDKSGKLFKIYDCEIWRLESKDGASIGQCAMFWTEQKREFP